MMGQSATSLITDEMVEKAVHAYYEEPLPSEMPVEIEARAAMRAALEKVEQGLIERYCRRAGLPHA